MIEICTSIENENRWKDLDIENIERRIGSLIEKNLNIIEDKQVSIVFTNDDLVHKLNKQYRNKDKSTNILSFAFNDDGTDGFMLGELFLAYDVIANEAEEQGKEFINHLTHILLHGFLHLLGFDHIENEEAEEMESLEKDILSQMGIDNPYR